MRQSPRVNQRICSPLNDDINDPSSLASTSNLPNSSATSIPPPSPSNMPLHHHNHICTLPRTPERQLDDGKPKRRTAPSPPPAPKAPSRAYRLQAAAAGSGQVSPLASGVARKLTFDNDIRNNRTHGQRTTSTQTRTSMQKHTLFPSLNESSTLEAGTPLLSLHISDSQRTLRSNTLARQMLGSPIHLTTDGQNSDDQDVFRTNKLKSKSNEKKRQREDEVNVFAPSSSSSSSSLGNRPKRSCTIAAANTTNNTNHRRSASSSKVPLIVRRSLYSHHHRSSNRRSTVSSSTAATSSSSSLCVELERSHSTCGGEQVTAIPPLRSVANRHFPTHSLTHGTIGGDESTGMGRSISYASYLAQTPSDVRCSRPILAPTPPASSSQRSHQHQSHHHTSHSLLSRACSPSSRSSSPALHTTPVVVLPIGDYFGNWSISSSLARAH